MIQFPTVLERMLQKQAWNERFEASCKKYQKIVRASNDVAPP